MGLITAPADHLVSPDALALVRFGWQTTHDADTWDTSLGVHLADRPTGGLPAETVLVSTFHWPVVGRRAGSDYAVGMAKSGIHQEQARAHPLNPWWLLTLSGIIPWQQPGRRENHG
jgi:hypothetical protein